VNPSLDRDPFDGHADEPLESLIAAEEAASDAGEEALEACLSLLTMLWSMGRAEAVRAILEGQRDAALEELEPAT
jgi:hypothetical protein